MRPVYGPLVLVNVRLALPHTIAALSGNAWYTEAQRRNQFTALRRLLAAEQRVVVCGDLNALPVEVDLDSRFQDMWSRPTYGATFPSGCPRRESTSVGRPPTSKRQRPGPRRCLRITGPWLLSSVMLPAGRRAV
jgi:hypothetical protein